MPSFNINPYFLVQLLVNQIAHNLVKNLFDHTFKYICVIYCRSLLVLYLYNINNFFGLKTQRLLPSHLKLIIDPSINLILVIIQYYLIILSLAFIVVMMIKCYPLRYYFFIIVVVNLVVKVMIKKNQKTKIKMKCLIINLMVL